MARRCTRTSAALARRYACLSLLLLGACGRTLPDYARPKTAASDPAAFAAADKIRYRTLTRSDFRGTSLPPQFGDKPGRFAAASCIYLHTAPGTQILTRPTGNGEFEARIQDLAFEAWLDRGCSWWNRFQESLTVFYVLQHEQLHFAIYEAHARRLNGMTGQIVTRTVAVGDSERAARAACQARLESLMRDEANALVTRNTAFDEDTSYGYDTSNQRRWHEQLERELRENAR